MIVIVIVIRHCVYDYDYDEEVEGGRVDDDTVLATLAGRMLAVGPHVVPRNRLRERSRLVVYPLKQGFMVVQLPRHKQKDLRGQKNLAADEVSSLAVEYTSALLRGDRKTALHLVIGAVDSGVDIQQIYLGVFQASQWEIGRLWETNQISVAQEHYCTAATQLILAQLYPRVLAVEKTRGRVVIAAVAGELHELGARIVADFFELEGWDAHYLGANTPTESVLATVLAQKPAFLGISATLEDRLDEVRALIRQLRAHRGFSKLPVLVGGHLFNADPKLWQKIGADGTAPDAQTAVAQAQELLRHRRTV